MSPKTTARAGLRLLRERSWLLALAGVVVLSVVFLLLGRWQYHRHEARSARNALIEANFDAAPAPLERLLPRAHTEPGRPLPPDLQWRPARLRGHYLSDAVVLLRNRPREEQNGYDVVVPFATTDGLVMFVDRGWIPAGTSSAARPDDVPAPPAGEVTVVVRLRPSEPTSDRRAPAGQANRLAVSTLATALPPTQAARVIGGYGLMVTEIPAARGRRPLEAPKPDPGLGINLAYAVQWVAFAVAAYVLLGVAMVRELRRREGHEPAPLRLPWRGRERDEYDED